MASRKRTGSGKKAGRRQWLKRAYGMTIEEYEILLISQSGKCAICGVSQEKLKQTLSVDHDHTNGKVRGLLCHWCNTGIGYFSDSVQCLQAAISYLHKNKKPVEERPPQVS